MKTLLNIAKLLESKVLTPFIFPKKHRRDQLQEKTLFYEQTKNYVKDNTLKHVENELEHKVKNELNEVNPKNINPKTFQQLKDLYENTPELKESGYFFSTFLGEADGFIPKSNKGQSFPHFNRSFDKIIMYGYLVIFFALLIGMFGIDFSKVNIWFLVFLIIGLFSATYLGGQSNKKSKLKSTFNTILKPKLI